MALYYWDFSLSIQIRTLFFKKTLSEVATGSVKVAKHPKCIVVRLVWGTRFNYFNVRLLLLFVSHVYLVTVLQDRSYSVFLCSKSVAS